MHVTAEFFLKHSKGVLVQGSVDSVLLEASIDSRSLSAGDWFFACQGKFVSGFSFVKSAYENGARGFVISRENQDSFIAHNFIDVVCIAVDDVLQALFDVARAWRNTLTCPVVAVTGSVGKTTTKEFLRSIFKELNVFAYVSRKNQNTRIGVALNLLSMSQDVKIGVFEAGISKQGEMKFIADLILPTMSVLTGVSESHISGLGSVEGILKEKVNLFTSTIQYAVLGFDICKSAEEYIKKGVKVITCGFDLQADVCGLFNKSFDIYLRGKKLGAIVGAFHKGIAKSFLIAVGVAEVYCKHFNKLDLKRVYDMRSVQGRYHIEKEGSSLVINDAYNANPESMKYALQAFDKLQWSGKKIAVVADMLELGEMSKDLHEKIGNEISFLKNIDEIIFIGSQMKYAYLALGREYKSFWYGSVDEACKETLYSDSSAVLYKGSRGMNLDMLILKKHKKCKKGVHCDEVSS